MINKVKIPRLLGYEWNPITKVEDPFFDTVEVQIGTDGLPLPGELDRVKIGEYKGPIPQVDNLKAFQENSNKCDGNFVEGCGIIIFPKKEV